MTESELIRRSEYTPPKRAVVSPIDRKIAELPPGKYYKLTEVAQILGVSPSWLRRRLTDERITAPTWLIPQGDAAPGYLYTAEDIEELKALRTGKVRKK